MSFRGLTTDSLLRIVHTGVGITISGAGRTSSDLISLAHAAHGGGGLLTITDLAGKTVEDLIKIGHAGRNNVVLQSQS